MSNCILCPFIEALTEDVHPGESQVRVVIVAAFTFGVKLGKSERPAYELCEDCTLVAARAIEIANGMPGTNP